MAAIVVLGLLALVGWLLLRPGGLVDRSDRRAPARGRRTGLRRLSLVSIVAGAGLLAFKVTGPGVALLALGIATFLLAVLLEAMGEGGDDDGGGGGGPGPEEPPSGPQNWTEFEQEFWRHVETGGGQARRGGRR